MPTYEYRCQACEHAFEQFQSISAPVLRKCPQCGKPRLKRLIGTGAGVIFKGSGFYQTDYRSESYKKAAQADQPKTDSKSQTKTDSKTSGKTPAKDTAQGSSKSSSDASAA